MRAMDLWRGLAAVGMGALVVALLSLAGTYSAVQPARELGPELVSIAYLAFFLGVGALLAATVARGISQVGRAIGFARRTD